MAIDLPILLRAYAAGLFPMADDRAAQSVFWVQPDKRAVLPLEGFHLSKSLRKLIHARFDLSLGTGLGKLKGRMFRMGHLGDSNDLTLVAMVAGVEMGLKLAGVKLAGSGVQATMEHFSAHPAPHVNAA